MGAQMIGLLLSLLLFNLVAFTQCKRLTANQILHIWAFTIAFQGIFDVFVEFTYHGYWYFEQHAEWKGLLCHTILIPPVNMLFLNGYPFRAAQWKQVMYVILWVIGILLYEMVVLFPEPWGYFHYGWWTVWHSIVLDPVLLLILLGYYRWVVRLEAKLA
jgi:hypothetical protein